MSESERAQENRSEKLRIILLVVLFLVGAISSVYTGIKCILFDFEGVAGDEAGASPQFLLLSRSWWKRPCGGVGAVWVEGSTELMKVRGQDIDCVVCLQRSPHSWLPALA
eukprot:SAG31_NODE_764_length_12262_cov_26.578887_5_plen_110_part_00